MKNDDVGFFSVSVCARFSRPGSLYYTIRIQIY